MAVTDLTFPAHRDCSCAAATAGSSSGVAGRWLDWGPAGQLPIEIAIDRAKLHNGMLCIVTNKQFLLSRKQTCKRFNNMQVNDRRTQTSRAGTGNDASTTVFKSSHLSKSGASGRGSIVSIVVPSIVAALPSAITRPA